MPYLAMNIEPGTFEGGVAGWVATNGTLTQSQLRSHQGTYSGLLTAAGTGSATMRVPAGYRVAVKDGQQIRLQMWVHPGDTGYTMRREIDYYGALGYISTVGADIALPASQWTLVTYDATVPVGATSVSYGPTLNGAPPAGRTLWVDEVELSVQYPMLVGATVARHELDAWEPRLAANGLTWIEPNSDGMPPSWSDARFAYCQRTGAIPIIGMRTGGDRGTYETIRRHLANMPSWMTRAYVTNHPEPEKEYASSPAAYIDNFRDWYLQVITALPPVVRAKVKAGPVLSMTWIMDPAGGNGDFGVFDPGVEYSDYFAVNYFAPVEDPVTGETRTTYPSAFDELKPFRDYRPTVADDRDRLMPRFGAIGLPADLDGMDRQAWLFDMVAELEFWTVALVGFNFIGASYWNASGDRGADLPEIGPTRYYQLDVRQSGYNVRVVIPPDGLGFPAAPLWAYNYLAIDHSPSPGDPVPVEPPPLPAKPVPDTQIELPPGGLPTTGPAAAKLLRADYTILVTDANLDVIGDPISEWLTLQASIRWKEPSSGQITVPAHAYIREQLVPGCRIVIIRRVLGTQHILIAGPVEKVLRERADGGENGGVGMFTISFVDDLAWLGARLAFPNPALPIDQQTTDYWEFSGDPEQAMLTLVNGQAGPGALLARRVPRLRVAEYSGIAGNGTVLLGPTSDVEPRERLEKCTDILRKIATLGANPPGLSTHHPDSLGFRIRQTSFADENYLLFEPVRSRDLSGEVHFSFSRGNVEFYSFEQEAPIATHILVGGQGEANVDKFIREIPTLDEDQLAWGRFETYLARPGSDPLAAHEAAAAEEFADKGQSARLSVNASDTVDQRYGVHYNAGDVVSVLDEPFLYVSAPVQTVNIQAWPTAGEVAGVTIGDQSARFDSPWIRRIRELERRVSRNERR